MAIYLGNQMVGVNGITGQEGNAFVTVSPLSATENTTYTAPSGVAYSPVTVNVSPTLTWGVIRPDTELVQQYSYDHLVISENIITKPEYKTSSSTALIAASSDTLGTHALDTSNYDYYILERAITTPVYNTNTTGSGRWITTIHSFITEIIAVPSLTLLSSGAIITELGAATGIRRVIYYSNASTKTTSSNNYGFYQPVPTHTITSGTLNITNPGLSCRNNSSIFSQTYHNALTDVRTQYIIELYRAPKNNLNIDGWNAASQFARVRDCVLNNNGNLI